jgi:hypothetical protein
MDEFMTAPPGIEFDISLVPHFVQGIALLADTSFACMAAGDNAGAAELLNMIGTVAEHVRPLADQIAGLGMITCKDGRPSLDGNCLKLPPCQP